MEIDLVYVKDKGPAAHIWDYLKNRSDHALCGHGYLDPILLEEVGRPRAVCRACQALTPRAKAAIWREIAEESSSEYETLWTEYEDLWAHYESLLTEYDRLQKHSDNQRREIRNLRAKWEPLTKQTRLQGKPTPPPKKEKFSRRVRPGNESPRKRPRVRLLGCYLDRGPVKHSTTGSRPRVLKPIPACS